MTDETVITAPETTTVTAPETAPVTTTPVETTPPEPAKGSEEALRAAVGKALDTQPGFEVTKPAVKTPEQVAAELKVEADRKAAEDALKPKTPEEKAAEDKAVADKAAADAKVAEEKAANANPLDKLGPLPVETLAKAITDNPALAAELEKSGIDSELLYETSRRAALTDQFTEIFPTPDAAKFAGESAQHFYDIEEGFPKIQTVEDLDKFVTGTMLPLSVIRGADGQPLMTEDGRGYQTDGSIARFFNATSQFETVGAVNAVDKLLASYAVIPGEEGERLKGEAGRIREALILAQQFRDSGYKLPGAKVETGKRSAEDQALIDDALRTKNDAAKATNDAREKENEAFHEGTLTAVIATTGPFIKGTLDMTDLTDNDKRSIAKETQAEAWESLRTNRHFQQNKFHLQSLGNTPENRAAIVSATKVAFEIAASKLMKAKIEEYGGKYISKQKAKLDKIDKQLANDKMNQGTGTTPGAKPAVATTPAQIRTKAIENYKARNHGASPDDGEILSEVLAIKDAMQRSA